MLFSSSYKYTMQVSPSGMAAASQAVPGEFDSRHLLQNKEHPSWVLLFLEDKERYDESRGWSREWERALCLTSLKFRLFVRQSRQLIIAERGATPKARLSSPCKCIKSSLCFLVAISP